jgi:short-subunit dehydrogenase
VKNLENRVIIVAGGTGGIGCATARLLVGQGAIVVVVSRRNTPTESLIGELKRLSPRSSAFQGDLGQSRTWLRLVDFVHRKYQRIDGLVNCAGLLNSKNLENLASEEIESMIGANLLSVVFGAQAILPVMRRQGEGHIITLGSLGGIVPMPFASLYCATKHAVRGFSLSLSEELRGTGIKVSLLSLGPVRTKMLDAEALNDQAVIAFINTPLHPESIAETVVSLLRRPQRELILPWATSMFSLLCNLSAGLFEILYRVLQRVGRARLRAYRTESLTSQPVSTWENYHVRIS